MSTMTEAIEHVLASREVAEKVAAAREEQRASILHHLEHGYDPDFDDLFTAIAEVRLTDTPLADTIKDLRADLVSAAAVTKQLEAELGAAEALNVELEAELQKARLQLHAAHATYAEVTQNEREEAADVAEVTRVVRAADLAFETSGGSSRHWVADQLLPRLEEAGLRIVKLSTPEKRAGASTPHPPSGT